MFSEKAFDSVNHQFLTVTFEMWIRQNVHKMDKNS